MIFDNLNAQQIDAVTAPLMPVCVLAGAGSGKTRVLTNRIAYLVNEINVDPKDILAMTFTKKAAEEMQERVDKMMPKAPHISTIHSLCYYILMKEVKNCKYLRKGFKVASESFISDTITSSPSWDKQEKEYFELPSVLNFIREQKELKHMPDDAEGNSKYIEIYRYLQSKLIAKNMLTYDDIIMYTAFLLEKEEIKQQWQSEYKYVLVDEYQDTSPLQSEIINDLTERSRNIYVVGDNDQSIYGFRGADMSIIMDFAKNYPEAKIYKLETNYRSDIKIITAANAVIKHNKKRFDKKLIPNSTHQGHISIKEYDTILTEANSIARETKRLNNFNDTAVLVRNNSQLGALEKAFTDQSIPFKLIGGYPFYKRSEILDILAYLELSCDWNSYKSFGRIANRPNRYLKKTAVQQVAGFCKDNEVSVKDTILNDLDYISGLTTQQSNTLIDFVSAINKMPKDLIQAVQYIRKTLHYDNYINRIKDDIQRSEKIDNLDMLETEAIEFANSEINSIKHFVSNCYSLQNTNESLSGVSLMTIHKAKGLEFSNVFVGGLSENILPSKHAKSQDAIEEERRLFYVAITRAKKRLYLSHFKTISEKELCSSRFLKEIPESLLKEKFQRSNMQFVADPILSKLAKDVF